VTASVCHLIRRAGIGWVGVGALIASTLVLAGCAGQEPRSSTPAPAMTVDSVTVEPLPSGAAIPGFSGAWAGQFRQAYQHSQSDLQRTVLADGKVTDEEMSALQDAFASCAQARGLTDISFGSDGDMSVKAGKGMKPEQVNAVVGDCGEPTIDGVDLIYNGMRLNPANADPATLMVECLVAVGLAPDGYSLQDYLRDSPSDSFPFDSGSIEFGDCARDPLGAATKK
jgi:hypothetical protein